MIHLIAIYTTVTLITGLALLWVWRRDTSQVFARHLGWAHLLLAGTPVAYEALSHPSNMVRWIGLTSLLGFATSYFILLVQGFLHLAGRRLRAWPLRGLGLGTALAYAVSLQSSVQSAQALQAIGSTVLGAAVAWWLRRGSPGERWCGLLLLVSGINQFAFAIQGDAALASQLAVGTVLRVLLVLALAHAALDRTAAEARRLGQRFTDLTERSHQGVVVLVHGRAVYANPAFLRIYGWTPGQAPPSDSARNWLSATVPEHERDPAHQRVREVLSGRQPFLDWEGDRLALDGRALRLRFSAWRIDWDGRDAVQMVVTDETERHRVAEELRHAALHDELTGLPNRAGLLQRLQVECPPGGTEPRVLVVLDIDRFKLFNEVHGHAVGDEVLSAMARELKQALGGQACITRLGEDEFAVLSGPLPAGVSPQAHAGHLTGRIRELVSRPLTLTRFRFFLDVSMGVALFPASADRPEALLQAANAAMHEAKRTPGTSVQQARPEAWHGLADALTTEQCLRQGLENEEFVLVYQPKVRAHGQALVGFEALVRWDRPSHGRVAPMDFIPVAERTGLIVPLGALIIEAACRQVALWRAQGHAPVPVAVNVSPLQLLDAGFPDAVLQALQRHALPPELLTLEITETVAVTHLEQACEQIQRLRAHGVEVALDDFGTGFSSLNVLRSLPLHTVKIDRSLIDPMPVPEATAVVRAICDLAATLALAVVAEGVENADHAEAARQAGCDVLQGFYYARPLEVDEATGWLDRAA